MVRIGNHNCRRRPRTLLSPQTQGSPGQVHDDKLYAWRQFQPMRFDVGVLDAAGAGYFASLDVGPFVASALGQGFGAGAGAVPEGGR